MGWIGVDQYDEGNPIGQDFLDRYAAKYDGSRPEFCVTVVNRDVAATLVRAFTDAHPLSPRGVKEALERVKMLPAASGAPGTRVSLGKWTRRAWMGSGYLVARTLDADGVNSHLSTASERKADMTTQESTPPIRKPDSPAARRTGPNWGRVISLFAWLGFLGLFAAVARTAVDPRVANPNVEGRPRPVEFLTGFDHWQVISAGRRLIMVVVLTIVFIRGWRRNPAARC